MTDVAIWQPQNEITAYEPPSGPLDDWIRVADQVVRLAEVICRTPFVPDGLRGNAPATAAAILTGRELQIPPMTALANIHVIHGKPGLSALVMRALVLSQGHEWQDVDVTNTRVIVRGRRKGETEWTTASFSAADAQTAKLQLGGYPQDKLYARATARLARRKFADVIAGMPYSIEELEDGIVPDEDEPAAQAPAAEQKPRTAQRAKRTQSPPSAQAATSPAASAPDSPSSADAGGALPPLPGEEDAPGPVPGSPGDGPGAPGDERHRKLVGTVHQHFKRLGYTDDDREERLVAASLLAGIPEVPSLNEMTHEELSTVADTLARCRDRERLLAVLGTRENQQGGSDE